MSKYFVNSFLKFALAALVLVGMLEENALAREDDSKLVLVVMDPLSAPLACDCVEGYAQRKYEKLAGFLAKKLDRKVVVTWAESIESATEPLNGQADIVIGKHSVVVSDARELKLKMKPVASLTGGDGGIVQKGLIVVRQEDEALIVDDLTDYRIFFGPKNCDEKYAAPIELLKSADVAIPAEEEIFGACSEAATKLVELPADTKAAAVISSYAAPLLEGCGTIKKGDLRVIGESREVPFVTAFVNQELDDSLFKAVTSALLAVSDSPELAKALETESGFIPFQQSNDSMKEAAETTAKKN